MRGEEGEGCRERGGGRDEEGGVRVEGERWREGQGWRVEGDVEIIQCCSQLHITSALVCNTPSHTRTHEA